jgi:hypothetical protein
MNYQTIFLGASNRDREDFLYRTIQQETGIFRIMCSLYLPSNTPWGQIAESSDLIVLEADREEMLNAKSVWLVLERNVQKVILLVQPEAIFKQFETRLQGYEVARKEPDLVNKIKSKLKIS